MCNTYDTPGIEAILDRQRTEFPTGPSGSRNSGRLPPALLNFGLYSSFTLIQVKSYSRLNFTPRGYNLGLTKSKSAESGKTAKSSKNNCVTQVPVASPILATGFGRWRRVVSPAPVC